MIRFYEDAGLTIPASRLVALQASDGSAPVHDRALYLGAQGSGVAYRAASDPGVDPIVVSIADADGGAGVAATAVKLAATQAALAGATAGAQLNLAASITAGPSGAVTVWVRIDTPALAVGAYDDLSLTTNDLVEAIL